MELSFFVENIIYVLLFIDLFIIGLFIVDITSN